MPIQFPDFQPLSFDQANPFLTGMSKGQNMMQSFMKFPQDMQAQMLANEIQKVNAKYAEPMAQGNLTKLNQENQWNPKIWQSEIGLRGAEAGKLGKETQWYDKEAQARINLQGAQTAGLNAEAGMNQIKLDYMKTLLAPPSANQGGGQGQSPNMGGGTALAGMGGLDATTNAGDNNMSSSSSPSAGAGYSSPTVPSPGGNSIYGIQTPTPTRDDIANKMLLGIDTFTPRMDNAKAQQQDQYTQYQKALAETISEANSAQKAKQVLAIFNNAMDNTGMKGPYWGTTPSTGWRTTYHPAESVRNAQIADTAVANLLPGAISDLREAMVNAKFSNLDVQNASRMKVDRTMDDVTRKTQSQWLNGVQDRLDEKAKFYTAMGNPRTGSQKVNTDMLWEQYQRDFPLISSDGKTYQGSSLGNWPLYTTPRAIASIQATGMYKPTAAEKNTFMMKYPDGQVLPVRKGGVEAAFRKGARPL